MTFQAAPSKANLTGTPTTGQYKTALGQLYDMIVGLFGNTGRPADAFAAMKLLDPQAIYNLALVPTVGANAMTMTLKSRDAATSLGAANPGYLSQRSATPGSGLYNLRELTADVALIVSAGSTLGHQSGLPGYLYWYVLDNAGVAELAVSTTYFGKSGIVTTVAEGGGGAADSASVMYSANQRTNVPFRLISRSTDTQPTAGQWQTVPTLLEGDPADIEDDRLPTGTIFHWSKPTPPDWALERNGATGLSRTAYAKLVNLEMAPGTFTVSIASPAVFTRVNHGYKAGSKVRHYTTGAMPTGLAANTDHYVIAAGLTADTYQVSTTPFGSAVNTTGSQSGVHTVFDHSVLGPGNGTTTFDLPDDRANFDRGWDDGRGLDASRVFGSEQTDDYKSHSHNFNLQKNNGGSGGDYSTGLASAPITYTTAASGGTETRPRNRAYLPCIAY